MPVVPISTAKRAQASAPSRQPPDEPWALMAAAQMHAEGRLVAPQAYIGELKEGADLSFDRTVPLGRRGEDGKVQRQREPGDIKLNPDEESYTLPDNPHLFIRKKREPRLEDLTS